MLLSLQKAANVPDELRKKELHKNEEYFEMIEKQMHKYSVVITTYNMMAVRIKGEGGESEKIRMILQNMHWGLQILDEVQRVPANSFKEAYLKRTTSHCKLGLTATPIREDAKIDDLHYIIGPKLYEESWNDLTSIGFLARVLCIEYRVPMHPEKMAKFNENVPERELTVYRSGNFNKFLLLKHLLKRHSTDKVLVMVHNITSLRTMGAFFKEKAEVVEGKTTEAKRQEIFDDFRSNPEKNIIFVSKVADEGFDVPEANVGIIVDSHGASRRQQAQRLGRIIRPKENQKGEYDAYFYSLVNINKKEIDEASRRQKFLAKQGYAFEISMVEQEDLDVHAIGPNGAEYYGELDKNERNRLKNIANQKNNE
jgi:DNA excision repair protein ERCC-3